MTMTYREQLNKARELNLNLCDLDVANECDDVFDFEYTEEEFEKLCEFACYIYLKSENLTTNNIAHCINDAIIYYGWTIEQVISLDKWEFIEKASRY